MKQKNDMKIIKPNNTDIYYQIIAVNLTQFIHTRSALWFNQNPDVNKEIYKH